MTDSNPGVKLAKFMLPDRLKRFNLGELVFGDHWRLRGLKIIDAVYPEKGIDSRLSPIETHILLVPPELVGTHEAVIGNPKNPHIVPEGFDHSGFAEIDFSNGWDGPAVAVATYTPVIYENLTTSLRRNGGSGLISDFEYGDLLTLDGHHRRAMAEEGNLRLKFIPVQLIPYPFHPSVVLGTWHHDGVVWTSEQVFACAKDKSRVADAKRTKFQIVGADGQTRRILHMQPDLHIPLEGLV